MHERYKLENMWRGNSDIMFNEKLLQKKFSNSIQGNVLAVLKICLYQSINHHGPDPGGHKITVLIWPVSFSKGLSALDV